MQRCLAILALVSAAVPALAQEPGKVSVDIYAIPSRPIVAAVDAASADLAGRGMTTFRAHGQAVHATLYLTQYPVGALPRLKAAMARLARGRVAFPLRVEGAERTPTNWLFLKLARTAALQRLADAVTLAAEPLRDHDLTPPAWMKDYPAKLPAFERYGSPNVFMQFDPHLTLLANERNPALADYMAGAAQQPPHALGQVEGIGIGLVDANGQIVRTVAEYRFAAPRTRLRHKHR